MKPSLAQRCPGGAVWPLGTSRTACPVHPEWSPWPRLCTWEAEVALSLLTSSSDFSERSETKTVFPASRVSVLHCVGAGAPATVSGVSKASKSEAV